MALRDKKEIRVLVVDDEQGLRDLLSYELGIQGYQVVTAGDGMEALEKVRQFKFDMVITDLKMPKMGGMETLEEIKKIDPNIEIIMATGFGTIEVAVDSMKKGAYDFIQKPYNIDEISALIEKALEKSQLKALIALYESSKAIFSTVKLTELLEIIMNLIQKVLLADEGSLMLLGEDGKLHIAASRGMDPKVANQVHLAIGERVAGKVAEERHEQLLINGFQDHPEFQSLECNNRIGSSIVIPLVYQNELVGVLNLNRLKGKDNFTPTDLANASVFASQVSQAVQNAKLYQVLENKIDELKTAYKMLEDTKSQLVESEKLASIGRLVAGVAHELNNPLTAVLGYTDLIVQTALPGELKNQLTIVFNEAQRCRRIVQDLLVFARWKKPVMKSVDLRIVLDEILGALALELERNKIEIKKEYRDCQMVRADASQLKQVFSNVLTNAMHAIQEMEGRRTIEIKIVPVDIGVQVICSDNGPGVAKEHLSKIFEPFFSTKEVGKGTGLGLSLSYGIVKSHGGRIWAEPAKGKGASFIVELPLKNALEEAGEEEPDPESNVPLSLSGKKILIVEDEPTIQNFIKRVLVSQGCLADSAFNGQEALDKLMKEDFEIVLCDYRLPLMNGGAVYTQFRKKKPQSGTVFLFVTGSAADKELDLFLGEHNLRRLMKPFTAKDLFGAMSKAMNTTLHGQSK